MATALIPLMPSIGQITFSSVGDFYFLLDRWKIEQKEWGRKFIGLDLKSIANNKFNSIESLTMPNNKKWIHKRSQRKNLKINKNAKIGIISSKNKTSTASNVLHLLNPSLDKTDELNKIFGKFSPTFANLPTNFDKPWSPYSGEVKMKKPKQRTWGKQHNNFPQK